MGFVGPSGWTNARLVNSAFRAAVAHHIRVIAVKISCKNPRERMRRLHTQCPNHRKMRLTLRRAGEWARWLDPELSPLVTHLTMSPRGSVFGIRDYPVQPEAEVLPILTWFSNLRSLTVGNGRALPCRGFDELLPHLPSLERIQTMCWRPEDVRALQRMPNLTSLDLVFSREFDGEFRLDEAVGFPKLRSLRIAGAECYHFDAGGASSEFLELLGRLTGLTSFTWAYKTDELIGPIFAPLANLSNLKSLRLKHHESSSYTLSDMLPVTNLTGLTGLHFGLRPAFPEAGPGILPAVSGLIHLRDLKVWGDCQPVSALSALRVESLHRLELGPWWDKPDAEGLAVLRRATGLTHLCFQAHAHEVDKGLGGVIKGLTRLRSLHVRYNRSEDDKRGTSACLLREEDLAPLTGLTDLTLRRVLNEHAKWASLAASLGYPAWFLGPRPGFSRPGGGVRKGDSVSSAHGGPSSVGVSETPQSPGGAHMLGPHGPKDAEGESVPDPWAVLAGIEDEREGFLSWPGKRWH
jgi:hypothetical protein